MVGALLSSVILLLFTSVCFANDYLADLYSENSYLTRESVAISQIRVRSSFPIGAGFSPYLQLGNELTLTGGGLGSVESDSSFSYAAPGIKWEFGLWTFFNEVRFRQFYQPVDAQQEGQGRIDVRSLLIYGNYFATRISPVLSSDLFAEIYSESVLTSADLWNVVLTDFVRLGLRVSPFRGGTVDLFTELFGTLDRIGHFYYNHLDFRPSIRLQYASSNFSVGVIGSLIASYFFRTDPMEENPYLQSPSGSRLLLVVGATL